MDKKDKQIEFLKKLGQLKASGIKSDDYSSPLGNDVNLVRGLPETPEKVTKVSGMTQQIDTKGIAPIISGGDFTDKINKIRALKALGKKAMGVIPLAGAGMAALSGDPAMAAEELAQDAMGPAGMALEAIKPEVAGNPEEEKEMLAERDARENYDNSPARKHRLKQLTTLLNHYKKND